MSLSEELAPHLPYLRRFARALCGAQESGDAYVVATLEALISNPDAFPAETPPKVGLYRLFMKSWGAIPLNMSPRLDENVSAAQRNLSLLTPRSRQAFLLKTVEGFSLSDVAAILDMGEKDVDQLLSEAGREIAALVATDVLIIEDEALIAHDIKFIAEDLGHRVMGVARTHREAVELASKKRPGLILADVRLADGSSGLNAVNELLASFEAPVIFITAFPERLLTGERPEPAFLVSKPFRNETLKATISQALFFQRKASRRA
ncbi:response regulator [Methylocystis sp. 9N]|uniref:Response regulator n=1 Tax=Methylocystis borbori TaxID=3118750 RepID=A0ABU7XGV0_9HYPH